MSRFCGPVLLMLMLALLVPGAARAALLCNADIVSLNFGVISVRDGILLQTSGPVTISCAGGTAGAVVQACVRLDAGSGGAAAGQSPRSLTGQGLSPLQYQLTAENSFSNGGPVWETRSYALTLDASGAASIAPMLYAQITAIGAEATVGAYSSVFEPGLGAALTFGETSCSQSGAASGFQVSASLTSSCSVSVTPMDFGVISNQITAEIDQTAQIAVSCTNGSGYTIGLDFGQHAVDAGARGRRMASGGNLLGYGLYQDAARSLDWGMIPSTQGSGTGTGGTQALTVYGRVFSPQSPAAGSYSDLVVITVTY